MVRPPDESEAAAIAVWDDLLRAYAEAIEHQRAYLLSAGGLDHADESMTAPPAFEIPTDIAPMPSSFEPWAMSLLTETVGLTELAHGVLSDRPLVPRAQRAAATASGSTLDKKI